MLISAKNIIGHEVYTQSREHLGRIADFDLDGATQKISKIHVRPKLFGFMKKSLIIDISQVVEMTNKEVIVKDAAVRDKLIEQKAGSDIEYVK